MYISSRQKTREPMSIDRVLYRVAVLAMSLLKNSGRVDRAGSGPKFAIRGGAERRARTAVAPHSSMRAMPHKKPALADSVGQTLAGITRLACC